MIDEIDFPAFNTDAGNYENKFLDVMQFLSMKSKYCVQVYISLALLIIVGMSGCSKTDFSFLNLMPAPDVYSDEIIDPFLDPTLEKTSEYIFYATDRKPDPGQEHFYSNERGFGLVLGSAKPVFELGDQTWQEVLRTSFMKNRTDEHPVRIAEITEFGVLDRTITVFTPPDQIDQNHGATAIDFAQTVNAKLESSNKKDIYIYVHGFKTDFRNPLLVGNELWHFLGYDGVFIAFAWPSNQETLAYLADTEETVISARNLRILTEFLSEETNAENIHLIGYSAGSRVVLTALAHTTFIHSKIDREYVPKKPRIGRVILVASEIDRQLVGAYLAEGLMNIPTSLTVYLSGNDKALDMSKRVFRRERLGQVLSEELEPNVIRYLNDTPELQLIDVSKTEGATEGNGHDYFRTSPIVSSDILVSLMYDLEPHERGLVKSVNVPIWTFPEDYKERLRSLLKERPVSINR